jgi:hypothetical protein
VYICCLLNNIVKNMGLFASSIFFKDPGPWHIINIRIKSSSIIGGVQGLRIGS